VIDRSVSIPVTLLAGYLGSGKTTLVNHVLHHANGTRIAVMVNDFGDLPIDASLIEATDDDIVQLSGGCVCCSYGNDLTRALIRLSELDTAPEHILIECSGVALPKPVKSSLTLLPALQHDGTIVMVDAEQINAQLNDRYIGDTVLRQIEQADLIAVNKSDSVDASALTETVDKLTGLVGDCVFAVDQAKLPIELALSTNLSLGQGIREDATGSSASTHVRFTSTVIRLEEGISINRLTEILTMPAFGVLRAKGYVLSDDNQWHLLQQVGQKAQLKPIESPSESGFVVIGVADVLDVDGLRSALSVS